MNKPISQDESLRRRLHQDIESVLDHVQDLHNSVYIFRKFRDLRNEDRRLLAHSPFIEWLTENYVHSAAVGVRKQLKASGVSLRSILDTLERNPRVISREHFESFFHGHVLTEEVGREQFDAFAGKGERFFGAAIPARDREALLARCKKVEHLVDKRIAHYEKVNQLPVPTFGELEDAVEALKEVSRKYSVLIRGVDRGFEFSYLEQWDRVLTFPWRESR